MIDKYQTILKARSLCSTKKFRIEIDKRRSG